MKKTPKFMQKLINREYVDWLANEVEERAAAGFQPYLFTFMFTQIPGSDDVVGQIMKNEVERFYYIMVDRLITRKRTSPSHRWKLPFFFVVETGQCRNMIGQTFNGCGPTTEDT